MAHPLGPPEGTTWHDLKNWSVASLIAANLVPLFGTLFLGWTSGDVLIVYWVETAVIGFYTILRMPVAWGWFALFSVPFFIVHFGVFLGIAGRLAIGAYVLVDDVPGQGWATLDPIRGELQVFAVLMLASHGVSFVTNFIGNKEYRLLKKDPEQLMVAPVPAYLRHDDERRRGGHSRVPDRGPQCADEHLHRTQNRHRHDRAPERT